MKTAALHASIYHRRSVTYVSEYHLSNVTYASDEPRRAEGQAKVGKIGVASFVRMVLY